MANILPRANICHILPREYMNLTSRRGWSVLPVIVRKQRPYLPKKKEGVGSTLPEYWNSNLWLAFILARSTDTSGTLSTPVMNNSIAVMKYLDVKNMAAATH